MDRVSTHRRVQFYGAGSLSLSSQQRLTQTAPSACKGTLSDIVITESPVAFAR